MPTRNPNHPRLTLLLAILFLAYAFTAHAQQIAFTWDDLPAHGTLPSNTTRLAIIQGIIKGMKDGGLPAPYGFVNGVRLTEEPGTAGVLEAWRAAGFPLGNHGYTHMNLNSHTAEQFEADIDQDEPLLQKLMGNADWHWLRYPNLAEGNTPEKHNEVRAYLQKKGYRIAAVTMSFADYNFTEPYARCVAKNDQPAIDQLKHDYLQAASDEADYRRAAAQAAYGRDIPYVLLMHVGGLDAQMLPQLIALYKQKGFSFISLEQAEKDPVFATDIDLTITTPPPSSGQLAAQRGTTLPHPPPPPNIANLCR
jgi:peptidoglycan/xylan/chitin deacetylase (PgdA/CDA1 family)